MAKSIKLSDIKWASNIILESNFSEGFINSLGLFIGEILRSDEIGLLVWRQRPILMVRISNVDFQTEKNSIEIINFEASAVKNLLSELNLDYQPAGILCSDFEVFCYRPKPNKPYHPRMYPTYIKARERASRILDGIFTIVIIPDKGCGVSYAYVDEKAAKRFFLKMSKQKVFQNEDIKEFTHAVDKWIGEYYTDAVGSRQYRTKNRYPIAPQPITDKDALLSLLT